MAAIRLRSSVGPAASSPVTTPRMRSRAAGTVRRLLAWAALFGAASCDDLNCYDDTDRPLPFPQRSALPLDTPTRTDDGTFELLLRAPTTAAWPPRVGPVALSIEVRGLSSGHAEVSAEPPFFAEDPTRRGGDAEVTPRKGTTVFRVTTAVPAPGLWCLPVFIASSAREDDVDLCFEVR